MDPNAKAIDGRVMSWMFVKGAALKDGRSRGGEQVDLHREHESEDGADHERGHGEHAEGGHSRQTVEEPVRTSRRHEREGNGDGKRDDLRVEDQLEVERECVRDDGRHVLMVEEGLAEVPVQDVRQPRPVLREKRLVEAKLLEQRCAVRRGLVRSEDRVDRVTGQQVDEQERQDRDDEDDHDQLPQTDEQVTAHRLSSSASGYGGDPARQRRVPSPESQGIVGAPGLCRFTAYSRHLSHGHSPWVLVPVVGVTVAPLPPTRRSS